MRNARINFFHSKFVGSKPKRGTTRLTRLIENQKVGLRGLRNTLGTLVGSVEMRARREWNSKKGWCVPGNAFKGMKRGLTPEFTSRHFALALTWLIESWTGPVPFLASGLPHGEGCFLSHGLHHESRSDGIRFDCVSTGEIGHVHCRSKIFRKILTSDEMHFTKCKITNVRLSNPFNARCSMSVLTNSKSIINLTLDPKFKS